MFREVLKILQGRRRRLSVQRDKRMDEKDLEWYLGA